jgi:hypothetical protein
MLGGNEIPSSLSIAWPEFAEGPQIFMFLVLPCSVLCVYVSMHR